MGVRSPRPAAPWLADRQEPHQEVPQISTCPNTAPGAGHTWGWDSERLPQTLTPRPRQEAMVDMGDLGQDLEHCLQLRRQLHKLRGVWAQVWGPCGAEVSQLIPKGHLKAQSSDPAWVLPSSVLTICMCLARPPISPSLSFFIFKIGITPAS